MNILSKNEGLKINVMIIDTFQYGYIAIWIIFIFRNVKIVVLELLLSIIKEWLYLKIYLLLVMVHVRQCRITTHPKVVPYYLYYVM